MWEQTKEGQEQETATEQHTRSPDQVSQLFPHLSDFLSLGTRSVSHGPWKLFPSSSAGGSDQSKGPLSLILHGAQGWGVGWGCHLPDNKSKQDTSHLHGRWEIETKG